MNIGWGKKSCLHVKNEGSNLNVMITIYKSVVSCECLGLEKKTFKVLVLSMLFLKLVNMWQQLKKGFKISSMFLLSLFN